MELLNYFLVCEILYAPEEPLLVEKKRRHREGEIAKDEYRLTIKRNRDGSFSRARCYADS